MKDTKKILRTAIYNALNGNITYSSVNVPVFDEKAPSGNTYNNFIILSTQQEVDIEGNSECWITDSSIDIEIYCKTFGEVSKDMADDIYESMVNIIFPSRGTIGLTVPSGFLFQEAKRESCVTQSVVISETESIIISRVKLVFTITEK